MAPPRTLNNKTKRIKIRNQPAIKSLPSDLLTDVFARVGSSSMTDLFNIKLCCKDFNEASNNGYVLEHISMDTIPPVPWRASHQESRFLRLCKESGNPEGLYRQGMIDFFSHVKLDSGLEFLRKAATKGHVEACYVYGIVLVCCGGQEKVRGIELLSCMDKNKLIKGFISFSECRRRIKKLIRSMWINNRIIQQVISNNLEAKNCCCSGKKGWDGDVEDDICCSYCRWVNEATQFSKILSGGH